jgi:hypothetical protein
MIKPEHPFDMRPDLRKAETTKAETTTAETVIRPKQLVRMKNSSPAPSKKNTGINL